jgi:ribosomal protein L40E
LVDCPKCGTKNPEGAKFCNNCGAVFEAAQKEGAAKKVKAAKPEAQRGVCPKCGNLNPADAEFCFKCGTRFGPGGGSLDGLMVLSLTGVLYTVLSAALNEIIRSSTLFLGLYLGTGVLGIVVLYGLRTRRFMRWIKFVCLAMVAVGLSGTFLMYLIGLGLRGVVGPGWVIFVVMGWRLWQDRYSLSSAEKP